MPAAMETALEQAQSGEISFHALRDTYLEEVKNLRQADEASLDPKEGWLAAGNLLAGESKSDKMLDFIARTKALGPVGKWLSEQDSNRVALADIYVPKAGEYGELPTTGKQFYAPDGTGDYRAAAGGMQSEGALLRKAQEAIDEQVRLMSSFSYQLMEANPDYLAFKGLTPAQRAPLLVPGATFFKTDSKAYLAALKAVNFSTGVGTSGILPSDRMGMPYDLMVSELDHFNIMAEQGSIIRYFTAPPPALPNPQTGSARVRDRGGDIHEYSLLSNGVIKHKFSLGTYAEMWREDMQDHGQIPERVNRQLDINMRTLMAQQILNGAGDAQKEWSGVAPALTAAPGTNNITQLGLLHNSVAVHGTNGTKEPVAFFELLLGELAQRGCYPTVIFVNTVDWGKIRESQRALRNQGEDYARFPFGQILGVRLQLTRHLPANTAIIGDMMKMLDVITSEDIETGTSEDFQFQKNAIAIRRTMRANTAIMMDLAAIKVTATNLFVPQTL